MGAGPLKIVNLDDARRERDGLSDAADRADIQHSYTFFLGRSPDKSAFETYLGMPVPKLVRSLLASSEFDTQILSRLLSGLPIPQDSYLAHDAAVLLDWAEGALPLGSAFVRGHWAESWSRPLLALLVDPAVSNVLLRAADDPSSNSALEAVRVRIAEALADEPRPAPGPDDPHPDPFDNAAVVQPSFGATEIAPVQADHVSPAQQTLHEHWYGEDPAQPATALDNDRLDARASDTDVEMMFAVVLGRRPGKPALDSYCDKPLLEVFVALLASNEFETGVLPKLHGSLQLPHHRNFEFTPGEPVLTWAAARFGVGSAIFSWPQLLAQCFFARSIDADVFGIEIAGRDEAYAAALQDVLLQVRKREQAEAQIAKCLAAHPFSSKQADANDLSLARRLFLCSGPSDPEWAKAYIGRPLWELIRELATGAEFAFHVLPAILQGALPTEALSHSRPGRKLVDWLHDTFAMEETTATGLRPDMSWRILLRCFLGDPLVATGLYPDLDPPSLEVRFAQSALLALRMLREASPQIACWKIDPDRGCLTGKMSDTAEPGMGVCLRGVGSPCLGAIDDHSFAIALTGAALAEGDIVFLELTDATGAPIGGVRIPVLNTALLAAQTRPTSIAYDGRAGSAITIDQFGRRLHLSVPLPLRHLIEAGTVYADGQPLPLANRFEDSDRGVLHHNYGVTPFRGLKSLSVDIRDGTGNILWAAEVDQQNPFSEQVPLEAIGLRPDLTLSGYFLDFEVPSVARIDLIEDGVVVGHSETGERRPSMPEFGLGDHSGGFSIDIPISALDGKSHVFSVFAISSVAREELGQFDFELSPPTFDRFLAATASDAERGRLLERTASAGRLDLVERYLVSGYNLEPAALVHLATLLFVKNPLEDQGHVLRRLHNIAWARATGDAESLRTVSLKVCDDMLHAMAPEEQRSLVMSELKASIIDICFSLEPSRASKPERGVAVAEMLLKVHCVSAAEVVIDALLRKYPATSSVLVAKARVLLVRGLYDEAADVLLAACSAKDAKASDGGPILLARALHAMGRSLDAIDHFTRGAGIAAEPNMINARAALPLNWNGFIRKAANEPVVKAVVERWSEIAPAPSQSETFSVFYLNSLKGSFASRFQSYGPNCLLATSLDNEFIDEAPVIGDWAIVLATDKPMDGERIAAIWRERRAGCDLIRIESRTGPILDRKSKCVGFMLRSAHFNRLPQATFSEATEFLANRLIHMTVLI